jgi:hypothetical protein
MIVVSIGAGWAAIPLLLLFVVAEPRAVRFNRNGATLRFVGRTVTVPWSGISPDARTYSKSGFRVRYLSPGRSGQPSLVMLTPAQGQAMLVSQ